MRETIPYLDGTRPMYYSLLLFVLLGLIAALASQNPVQSLEFFVTRYIFGIVLFFCTCMLGRSEKWRYLPIAFFFLLTGWVVLNSYYMIYQHHWLHIDRPKGFWKNPNPAAISIEIFLPTIVAYILDRRTTRPCSVLLLVMCVFPMIVGLIASQSRGAWIITTLVVSGMLIVQRNWRYLIGATSVGGALIAAYYPIILSRAQQTVDINFSSNAERINVWLSSIQIMKDHWLGIGFGQRVFYEIYPKYMLIGAQERLGHAHNIFLEFGVSGGPLLAISFITFTLLVIRFVIKMNDWKTYRFNPMHKGLIFGLAAFMGHMMVDFPLTARIEMWGVFMLFCGLLIGTSGLKSPAKTSGRSML